MIIKKERVKKRMVFLIICVIAMLLPILASCAQNIEVSTEHGILANNNIADFYFYYPPEFTLDKNASMISVYATDDERIETDIIRDNEVYNLQVVHPNLSATVFGLPEEYKNIDEYWENDCLPLFEKTFSSIEVTGTEELTINDCIAKRYDYTATLAGMEFQYSQVFIIRGGHLYTLTYTATPQKFARYEKVLDTALTTFAFK